MVLHRLLVNCRGCMLLYKKCIWCSGFPEIYAIAKSMLCQLEKGWGQSARVYVHSAIYDLLV